MTGDINLFRKRFFGGFNKDDVVGYITKLAQERNALVTAKDTAESTARALAGEVAALRLEIEDAKRVIKDSQDKYAAIIETAEKTLVEYDTAFEHLCNEVETTSTNIFAQLKNASESTAKLKLTLSKAGERLGDLRMVLYENPEATCEAIVPALHNADAGNQTSPETVA